MGYLLKEALKALCGVNHWSYAVFWKIGCQNPKLLIWEECYNGSLPNPDTPHISHMGNNGITMPKQELDNGAQVGDPVQLLMDKMMMSNQVCVVGEGLVGRAAFTGNHQWIVSGNYHENAHPMVLNEVLLQFSAGIRTIAIIPVVPHGVVQFGSPMAIMENVGFVHDVKSVILKVGCVSSVFMSDNYITKNVSSSMYELQAVDVTSVPIDLHGNRTQRNSSIVAANSFNLPQNSCQTLRHASDASNALLAQFRSNLQVCGTKFMIPNLTYESCKSLGDHDAAKNSTTVDCSADPSNGRVESKFNGDVVMVLKHDSRMNQSACSNVPVSRVNGSQPFASCRNSTLLKQSVTVKSGVPEGGGKFSGASTHIFTPHLDMNEGHLATKEKCNGNLSHGDSELAVGANSRHGQSLQKSTHANVVFHGSNSPGKELIGLFNAGHQFSSSGILGIPSSGHTAKHSDAKTHGTFVHETMKAQHKLHENVSGSFIPDEFCDRSQVPSSADTVSEDVLFQSSAGDDLFDVLGVDFKNKLLNGNNSKLPNGFGANTKDQIKNLPRSMNQQNLSSGVFSDYYEGISENDVFSSSGSDHLLDAVISGVGSAARQVSDDNTSCRTTLSKLSSSSVPSTPHSNSPLSGQVNLSDQMQGQLLWPSKPIVRSGEPISTPMRSACGKNDAGSCSLSSSAYDSQISSWIEQGTSVSVSTANSKKPDEAGKTNRKRLKPGENPRPRPKDRQMIQDRVKELRELVPNGAKCSIDALLERTIKHMLFLQSVTKHADKLKQTVKSKLTSREGGMLLKENSEGGATWAFELGSKSMVCPIVVEDLNPPRQLLIEMLCENRGFFLEIADIIRGLGLTILKGVMEARNDKIWAHFAVEANRDVTRMEVFISLIHLVEQTLNGSAASANASGNENLKARPASTGANQ